MGKQWKQCQTLFWGAPKSLQMVIAAMKLRRLLLRTSYDQPRQHIKKQRHYFTNKGLSSQSYGFSSSHVWMWELDYKESWAMKNWCFWTVVLEKTLESLLDCKNIQPVNPKGNQSWIFIGRLMLKLKLQYFGHLMWRTGVSALASVLPKNTQDWSPLGWSGWISLQSNGLSRVFSNTTVQKHQFVSAQLSSQSNSHIHTWPLEKP